MRNNRTSFFNSTLTSALETRSALLFVLLCLSTLVLLLLKKIFIENQTAAFEILEERGEMGVIHIINTLQYFSIPLVYLFKLSLTAFILWIGSFMFGYKITFSKMWQICIIAEFIFFLPEIIKIGWFLFVDTDPDFFDIRRFYPLSMISLYNIEDLPDKWFYPLKAANLFEVLYWFLLAALINLSARKKRSIATAIVFSSYVPLFIIWLAIYVSVYK
ncbi:MAG: hypothetical protein AAFX87_14265 [Bacteroidota bacterium]